MKTYRNGGTAPTILVHLTRWVETVYCQHNCRVTFICSICWACRKSNTVIRFDQKQYGDTGLQQWRLSGAERPPWRHNEADTPLWRRNEANHKMLVEWHRKHNKRLIQLNITWNYFSINSCPFSERASLFEHSQPLSVCPSSKSNI
jgi:hypothetical protein